jgi:hypothetical protein
MSEISCTWLCESETFGGLSELCSFNQKIYMTIGADGCLRESFVSFPDLEEGLLWVPFVKVRRKRNNGGHFRSENWGHFWSDGWGERRDDRGYTRREWGRGRVQRAGSCFQRYCLVTPRSED